MEIAKQEKLLTMDENEIHKIIDSVLKDKKNSQLIQERKEKAIPALMGEIMKKVRGRASGKIINAILIKKINKKK